MSSELTYLLGPGNRARIVASVPNNPTLRTVQRNRGLTPPARQSAFTLTELLVVMVILTLLTTMTVYAVNFSFNAERSRAAARQVQSYLEGARDRAIYERHRVGVRFLLDPDLSLAATSMMFIEEIEDRPEGTVSLTAPVNPGDDWLATRTSGSPTWNSLVLKGLLVRGLRIKIPQDDGFWYTIQAVDGPNERVTFRPDFKRTAGSYRFELELPPLVRPNQEPVLLPRGIAVDLSRSLVPPSWPRDSSTGVLTGNRMDLMFSPRGTLTGRPAASGLIHFYLTESADIDRLAAAGIGGIPSDTPYGSPDDPIGDRILVTLFPQTGAISSHPIDPTDAGGDNLADDPFRYAETGEVAGE